MNTGADLRVYLCSRVKGHRSEYIHAANRTDRNVGHRHDEAGVTTSPRIRNDADVECPVIGINILFYYYNLLVDPRNQRLLDAVTHISAKDQVANGFIEFISTIMDDTLFHQLLMQYPILTRPAVFENGTPKHQVEHHIQTTPGNWLQTATKQRRTR